MEGAPGPREGRAGRAAHAGTHLAEEEADLAAAGIASERGQAPHAWDQLGQALAAAVHLGLSAGKDAVSVALLGRAGEPFPLGREPGPSGSHFRNARPRKWAGLRRQGKFLHFLVEI